jgi:predicted dehydrogenase
VFVASTGDLPGTNRLEIDCEKGKLVCENGEVRVLRLGVSEREICFTSDDPWYRGEAAETVAENDGKNPQHAGVINAFAAHLLRGEHLVAEAEDGLRALQLSNAIHLSGWTGKRVEIPVSTRAFNRELNRRIAGSKIRVKADVTYETDHS